MKAKQRTEITYEAHETTLIRYAARQSMVYCPQCGRYAPDLSMAQATSMLSTTPLEIERSIQDDEIHAIENGGRLVLCGNSVRMLLLGGSNDE